MRLARTLFVTVATWLAVYSWLALGIQPMKYVLIWFYGFVSVVFLIAYIARLANEEDVEEKIKKQKKGCVPCFYLGESSDLSLSFVFAYHGHYVVATLLLAASLLTLSAIKKEGEGK